MEHTTKEKINVLINYNKNAEKLTNKLIKIDMLMDIFTYGEILEIVYKLSCVEENILSVIDRLKQKEVVEK